MSYNKTELDTKFPYTSSKLSVNTILAIITGLTHYIELWGLGKKSAGKAINVRLEIESHPQNHPDKMASFSEILCLKRKGEVT